MKKSNSSLLFNVDKEKYIIRVKKIFSSNVKSVWDAFTKQEILDQWWAPKPWKAVTKKWDFTIGGVWLYAMEGPAGEKEWAMAEYKAITPYKYIKLIDAFCDAEGNLNPNFPRYNWEIIFTTKGMNTEVDVLIHQKRVEDLEKILEMGFKEGFTLALEGLDELLAKQN